MRNIQIRIFLKTIIGFVWIFVRNSRKISKKKLTPFLQNPGAVDTAKVENEFFGFRFDGVETMQYAIPSPNYSTTNIPK